MNKTLRRYKHDSLPQQKIDKLAAGKSDREKKRFPVPISPLINSALRAIYPGGPKTHGRRICMAARCTNTKQGWGK